MARFKRVNKRMAKKTKLRVRRKVRRTSKIVRIARSVAKSVVARAAETKSAYINLPGTLGTYTSFNNTIALADFVSVMPNISQGTTENTRIGNKIKVKGLYVKGSVQVTFPSVISAATTSLNIYVRLLCLEDKQYLGSGVGSADILQRNGTNTQFLGYPQDLNTPVDRSRYIVHYDRVMKLQNPNWSTNTSGYINANVLTTRFFRFRVNKKDISYDSNTASTPNRFNPQFAAVVCDPSMVLAPSSPLVTPCAYTLNSVCYFEDA